MSKPNIGNKYVGSGECEFSFWVPGYMENESQQNNIMSEIPGVRM